MYARMKYKYENLLNSNSVIIKFEKGILRDLALVYKKIVANSVTIQNYLAATRQFQKTGAETTENPNGFH